MITASSTDGSITVAFTLHDGDGQVDTAVEDLTDAVDDVRIEIEIDALLDDPVPADWREPAARAARREQLTDTACQAARATVELLVHNRMALARGVQVRADDAPVVAMARATEALHRALVRYRHDTRLQDGLEVVQGAMAAEAGPGVAAVATELLTRLWADLTERMLAIGPPRAD